jgi:hypothetical protein
LGSRYGTSETLTSLPLKYSQFENIEDLCCYDMGLEKHILARADEITEQQTVSSSSSSETTTSTKSSVSCQQQQSPPPLMPIPVPIQTRNASDTKLTETTSSSSRTTTMETQEKGAHLVARKSLDYLEFEHGLAPPDPWDTPKTMQDELRELYGSFMDPQISTSPSLHLPKKQEPP